MIVTHEIVQKFKFNCHTLNVSWRMRLTFNQDYLLDETAFVVKKNPFQVHCVYMLEGKKKVKKV
jgi:hypothetical protein